MEENMIECLNCHTVCDDNAEICNVCGMKLNTSIQYEQNNSEAGQWYDNQYAPKLQLPSNRNIVKYIIFSILTLGIYSIVIESQISGEMNIVASRADGKRTIPFLGMLQISAITLGIYGLVWNHSFANRIGAELKRRGYDYQFGAKDFWLWNVLGAFIIVGPFIYCYKKLNAMNMINASYNIYG